MLTAVVLIMIVVTKFGQGAWAVLVLTPILVLLFRSVHKHYQQVARQLSLDKAARVEPVRRHTALVLISGIHRGVVPALEFARSIAPDNTTALYVDLDAEHTRKMHETGWGRGIPLVVLPSPYRTLIRPIMRYIDEIDAQYDDDVLSVILPEFIPSKWCSLPHNQTALAIKAALLFRKGVVVISVPYHLEN